MGGSPQQPAITWNHTGSLATDRRHTDAKGQAGDRPARVDGSALHAQGRGPGRKKPQLTSGYLGLFDFEIRQPAESGQSENQPSELARMAKFTTSKPHHASRHKGRPYRSALQKRGRTDPNEITVFKMSIN